MYPPMRATAIWTRNRGKYVLCNINRILRFLVLSVLMILPLLNAKAQDVETTPENYVEVLPADLVPILSPENMEETPAEVYENRREALAVKTNLLEWGAWVPQYGMCPMPNIAVEYYPAKGHFSFGASFDSPWWMNGKESHKYFALRNFQLEARYYLRNSVQGNLTGAAFCGLYLSAYAHIFMYQIGFNEKKGWMGEGEGGGLGVGYVLPLTRNGHWRLDFNLQVGAFNTRYDPYVYGCPVENVKDGYYYYDYTGQAADFNNREYSLTWIGPTRIGVTVSYDLVYRQNHRKGLSLRNKEKGVQR